MRYLHRFQGIRIAFFYYSKLKNFFKFLSLSNFPKCKSISVLSNSDHMLCQFAYKIGLWKIQQFYNTGDVIQKISSYSCKLMNFWYCTFVQKRSIAIEGRLGTPNCVSQLHSKFIGLNLSCLTIIFLAQYNGAR